MILIGENINVMSKSLGPAIKEKVAKPIQDMAVAEAEKGMDYLDLNIGPARKNGPEIMEWIVKTVQEVVELPCSLDTTNLEAIQAGLKVHKDKTMINSVPATEDRLEPGLKLAKEFDANVIGLLWGPQGMPRDEDERAMLAVDFLQKADEIGIPNENIYFDPIVSPVSVEINQVKACLNFTGMLPDVAPGCQSVNGLSNISNGTPTELRHWINKTYLIMLMRNGMNAAIVDAFDDELRGIVKGEKQNLIDVVYKVMDEETVDVSTLNDLEKKYYKTARILTGQSLYSHSWLDI